MEFDIQLIIALNLEYIEIKKYEELRIDIDEIGKMLNGLITYRKTRD